MSRYSYLMREYPEVISKEDMRRILHIGKRKATWILLQRFIPYENNGKKTRSYTIKLKDVVQYLEESERNPRETFAYKSFHEAVPKVNMKLLEKFLKKEFRGDCDALSTREIHRITGYSLTAIRNWIGKGRLGAIRLKNRDVIPKDYLIEFLLEYGYYNIHPKSKRHLEIMSKYFNKY